MESTDNRPAFYFCSRIMRHFIADRKGWMRMNRSLLESDRRARAKPCQATAEFIMADPTEHAIVDHEERAQETARLVHKPTKAVKYMRGVSSVAEARHTGRPSRDDKDFTALPDYCPPLNTLPHRINCLKVNWHGRPIDLGDDPHRHRLHPEEVAIASTLRLDCATYLTSKRRIFERRLQCLRRGKKFRKTDAQQACKIDVNKASKLWTAFELVGWLDKSYMRHFL